jgi:hypothetical protein
MERNWPVYFQFDGLVFDVHDTGNRFGGNSKQVEEAARLKAEIDGAETTLARNSLHAQGRLKLTEWEASLTEDAMCALRQATDTKKQILEILSRALTRWNEDRQRYQRNGAVRAAQATLQGVAERGSVPFPIKAFHPGSPVRLVRAPDGEGQLYEGRMVALEDMRHPKETLTPDDLFVDIKDIKAIEAAGIAINAHASAKPGIDLETAPANDMSGATESTEHILGWWDATMDAKFWFRQPSVSPVHAAMLLCQHNPNEETEENALACTNDLTGPEDYKRLLNAFQALESVTPSPRTLLDWRNYAQARTLKYHAWIELWLETLLEELTETMDLLESRAQVGPATARSSAPGLGVKTALDVGTGNEKPWKIADPRDPVPKQSWFIPVRFFARALVKDDPTLLTKRPVLLKKIAESLKKVGVKKRGDVKDFQESTLNKALHKVVLD